MIKNFSNKLKNIFKNGISDDFFDDMEDLLVESDLGALLSIKIVDNLKDICKKQKVKDLHDVKMELANIISNYIIDEKLSIDTSTLNLFLILGVNGVGKTTTIGRLAQYYKNIEKVDKIVLSAGDTFRAAAIDQLIIHGERTGCRVVSQQHGADPGAVIFDTIKSAKTKGDNLILADTAGRMHNKANLIKELEKINKIILNSIELENYKKILVIDCTTGQNGLSQAIQFNEAVKLDGVILTKYDSSAKGGIIPALCFKLNIPFYFLGVGEGLDDLKVFDKNEFIKELIGI